MRSYMEVVTLKDKIKYNKSKFRNDQLITEKKPWDLYKIYFIRFILNFNQ